MSDGGNPGRARPRGAGTRYGALTAVVVTVAALLTFAGPAVTPAEAAPPCPGQVVRTVTLPGGKVVVHKNSRWVCAFTVAHRSGPLRTMSVGLQARGAREVVKQGRHRSRTLPVTVYAGQRCVRAAGSIGGHHRRSGWLFC
ncbi:hypothetical protein JNUCC64_23005 [Streptomyces sp. JNUCC 64]